MSAFALICGRLHGEPVTRPTKQREREAVAGRLAFERALQYDYTTVMGVTFFATLLVVAGNLLADVLYAVLDPRILYA